MPGATGTGHDSNPPQSPAGHLSVVRIGTSVRLKYTAQLADSVPGKKAKPAGYWLRGSSLAVKTALGHADECDRPGRPWEEMPGVAG